MTVSGSSADVLAGWEHSVFSARGVAHDLYRRGEGPAVIVVHEVPGITPAVTGFANEVVEAGFSVAMPLLVGEAGREMSRGYALKSITKVCVSG